MSASPPPIGSGAFRRPTPAAVAVAMPQPVRVLTAGAAAPGHVTASAANTHTVVLQIVLSSAPPPPAPLSAYQSPSGSPGMISVASYHDGQGHGVSEAVAGAPLVRSPSRDFRVQSMGLSHVGHPKDHVITARSEPAGIVGPPRSVRSPSRGPGLASDAPFGDQGIASASVAIAEPLDLHPPAQGPSISPDGSPANGSPDRRDQSLHGAGGRRESVGVELEAVAKSFRGAPLVPPAPQPALWSEDPSPHRTPNPSPPHGKPPKDASGRSSLDPQRLTPHFFPAPLGSPDSHAPSAPFNPPDFKCGSRSCVAVALVLVVALAALAVVSFYAGRNSRF